MAGLSDKDRKEAAAVGMAADTTAPTTKPKIPPGPYSRSGKSIKAGPNDKAEPTGSKAGSMTPEEFKKAMAATKKGE